MKKNFKKWLDNCISFFINHTAWGIAVWFVGILSLNIPKIISWVNSVGKKMITFSNFLSFVSLILLCVGIYLILKLKKHLKGIDSYVTDTRNEDEHESQTKQDDNDQYVADKSTDSSNESQSAIMDDIYFKKMTVELFVKSSQDIRYRIKFDGVANAECVESFSKKLFWTGDEYKGTKVLKSNVAYSIDDNIQNRTTSPFEYVIHFDEPPEKGEPIKLNIETKLSDKDKNMKSYSLFCIKYPIEELEMVLIANPEYIKNVSKCGYHDFSREAEFFRSRQVCREDVGDLIKYSYVTNAPKAWKCYCIEWEFSQEYKVS